MTLLSRLRSWYWRACLRARGARVGRNLRVEGPLHLLLRDGASCRGLRIGNDVVFGGRTFLRLRRHGRIEVGDRVSTGTDVWLVGANDATLSVGARTSVGSYCIFNGGHGLRIGCDGIIAAFVYINTSDHRFADHRPIREQGFCGAAIDIGNDVWLGGHVFVGKGVCIGPGAVIGAGAVVVGDIPARSVAVGNPARVIRKRVPHHEETEILPEMCHAGHQAAPDL